MAETEVKGATDFPTGAAAPPVNSGALREVEAMPVYTVEDADIDYAKMLQQFKNRALFVDGVRKEALSRTKPQHWLSRTGKDGSKTFSLMGPGAERIRTVAPIGFQNMRRREEKWTKESGAGYTIYYEGEVYLGSAKTGPLPVMGTCSSDDDFFSTERAELPYNAENPEHRLALEAGEGNLSADQKTIYLRRQIPASEVTKENIDKSALTNLVVNGVTRVLGIRNLSLDELKDVGIDVDKIGGFSYGSNKGGALAPAEEQKRGEIKKWLIELNGGDETKALADLKKRTAFNDYKGCESWDRLTAKQIPRHHDAIKKEYDAFRGDAGEGATKPAQGSAPARGGATRAAGGKAPGTEDTGAAPGGQKPLL